MATNSYSRIWKHRSGEFALGRRTLLMGIVNVTPDSFSDGGEFLAADAAADHALQLETDGADLVDFGAESTRPGSESVCADEQLKRLVPVLERVRERLQIPISVDTSDRTAAEACLKLGASIINDVTAFRHDEGLPEVCARYGAGIVLMHMRGIPATMQQNTEYGDLFGEIYDRLSDAVASAMRVGIGRDHLLVDPGIGFGKSAEQNYRLLGGMNRFTDLAAGVLGGPSRKGFTGEFNRLPPRERQYSTAAAVAIAVLNGADVVRVHDVREMRQVCDILDRFREIHERDSFKY